MTNPLFDALLGGHDGRADPLLHLADGGTLSYADFLDLSARLANALAAAGLAPGDRLAAQVAKSPEALALYAACIRAGVVFLPLNPAYTEDELSYFVEDSGARMLVGDPGRGPGLRSVAEAAGAAMETLDGAGGGTLIERASAQPAAHEPAPRAQDDLAAILYTSGTTGRSKGAMLTQRNLLSNALTLAEAWRFSDGDVLLHALPIFHTHGLFVATNVALATGGSMIFLPAFDLDAIARLLPRATAMMGVPTFYTRMLGDVRIDREATAHMRLFVSGSAPLLAETHAAFERRTGHRILERYGMTETNMIASNPYDGERRPGTVGHPLPGVEVRITDAETAREVPTGEIGQIEVRGPNVFAGYWRMPDKTAAELREDGFFVTGDLGRLDADGYLSIVGRDKDLIISGGYNVYPKEIEVVLDEQPGVLESAVVGVPHPDFGETPVGVLVAEGEGPDLERIDAAVRDKLARYKHPRRLVVVDALPRNAMGKVQKKALREEYADLFAPAEARAR